ncbi:MAG: SH3 domain-containing protein, partial [Clostridia bacterium]|nr:SH3 domain-containing protein [Clostridia bacterium]
QILKLNSLYIDQRYEMTDVLDILYLDKLYVLKADGVYALFSGEFVKLFEVENAICLSAPEDGTNVFVATKDEIIVIDGTGNKLPTTLTGDFTGLQDIAVDYAGNIVIAYETKVEVYNNNISSLEFVSTHPLDSENRATLTSCILVGNELYFTANESYVAKLTLNVDTKDTHTYPAVKESGAVSYFEKSAATYTLATDCRIANIELAEDGVLLVFKEADAPDGYYLAYDGINFLYIPKTGFEEMTPSTLSGEYVAKKQTVLFVTPNKDNQENVVAEEETHVIFKQKILGFDGDKWVVVELDGKEYFATASDFSEYVPPEPERNHTYGRAKGTRVGGIVNVYQSASTESAVILEIADGAKLEILETLDDFYKVSVDGLVGYMTKDEVQLGGLTTVQIVSIILAILVLLAGSTVFVAIYFTKKKQNENE